MKANTIYYRLLRNALLLCLLCGTAFLSCADEDIVQGNSGDGKVVAVSLNLTVPEQDVVNVSSRAGAENIVDDFYLFIFNNDGSLDTKYYFAKDQTTSNNIYSSNSEATLNRTSQSVGEISNIKMTTGNKKIMGVGNVAIKIGDEILSELATIKTIDGLKKVLAKEPSIAPSTFTMSGYYSPDQKISEDGSVNVTAQTTQLSGHIHLVRVDACVNFVVEQAEDCKGTFTLQSWQVMNAAKQVHLFQTGEEPADIQPFHSDESSDFTENGKFSFYVQARCAKGQKDITTTNYGDRAKANAELNEDGSKKFINAPSNATYVVLKGHFTGTSLVTEKVTESDGSTSEKEVNKEVDADVKYYVLLGENSQNNYNDYTTNRNTQYTYTVKVKGVNDITVEVRTDEEKRPDAEGDVVIMDVSQNFDFDAHYGDTVISFTKEQIQAAITKKAFGYVVMTPYGNEVYRDGYEETTQQQNCSEWVTFTKDVYTDSGKRYPKRYTGLKDTDILSVKGLLDDLKKCFNDNDPNDARVYYTAYIDEYYYEKNPKTGEAASWKDFVNTDDRKLFILADTEISKDGHSSVTTATCAFNQKSILTIYKDTYDENLKRAWGLETIEENLIPNYNTIKKGQTAENGESDPKYGRRNTLKIVNNQNWNDIIAEDGYLNKFEEEKNALVACMQRNRDLNRDGKISRDEVRWYVPTLSQYQHMYIGRYGIKKPEARLYNKELVEKKWVYKHYLSSNGLKQDNYEAQILWAEEGLSSGKRTNAYADRFNIRCVRDLGVNMSNTTWDDENQFQDIYTKISNGIELTYLNTSSVRTALEDHEIRGEVTTFNDKNKPAVRFTYNTELTKTEVGFEDEINKINNVINNESTACGTGWRIPTLPELSLLVEVYGVSNIHPDNEYNNKNLLTRTKFEFFDNEHDGGRYAHVLGVWNVFMLGNGNNKNIKGRIRCVRDEAEQN